MIISDDIDIIDPPIAFYSAYYFDKFHFGAMTAVKKMTIAGRQACNPITSADKRIRKNASSN